jgi:ELWxxDGT repeat protein
MGARGIVRHCLGGDSSVRLRLSAGLATVGLLLAITAPAAQGVNASLLKDINPGPANGLCCATYIQPANAAGTLFFGAYDGHHRHGAELWKSDGTRAGTALVADTSRGEPYVDGTGPDDVTAVGATVFFAGQDPTHGFELWKSDGTASGTTLVKDIAPNNSVPWERSSNPSDLTRVGNELFFVADDAIHGEVLWRSDGTAAGTRPFPDTYPGKRAMVGYRGELLFRGFDSSHGWELWKSDGTVAGTEMVKDIFPGRHGSYPNGSWPRDLTELDGTLYFTAAEADHGREVWSTDGTAAGTKLVADIYSGRKGSRPDQLAGHAGTLFFSADGRAHGSELWRSNGKPAGTRMVKDINPGSDGSLPAGLASVGPRLFFVARDGTHGYEPWKSDGTAAGTRLVKDIVPGKGHPYVAWLTGVGHTLFFSADDHVHGSELWSSNGTAAGTQLVRDIYPGRQRYGGYPAGPSEFRGALFFWADDPTHGTELWKAVP